MRALTLGAAAGLAGLSSLLAAQPVGPAPAIPTCYVQVRQLMATPPAGIGELGAAIHALDVALRPSVIEINALKAQVARLEQRDAGSAPAPTTSIEAAFADDQGSQRQAATVTDERTAEQVRAVQAQIEAKQAQLKTDYAAQQRALVGPIQMRINQRAQAFAASSGCPTLKMARTADLAALQSAGARDVTADFVAWYAAAKS